jgi:hypothetical protein
MANESGSWWDSVTNWMRGNDGGNAGLVSTLGGLILPSMGFSQEQGTEPVGYQGSIPDYTAVRTPVEIAYDPDRRPGSGGRRYFSDVAYAPTGAIEGAQAITKEQAEGLAALNAANPYKQNRPAPIVFPERQPREQQRAASKVAEDLPAEAPAQGLSNFEPKYAKGGIAMLAKGRYLNGDSDGMADEVRANIDGVQEARLSDGEYVIPADVVSHLGNGNSEAGAKVLDNFLAKVRKERTGNEKQGKEINPMKMLPS